MYRYLTVLLVVAASTVVSMCTPRQPGHLDAPAGLLAGEGLVGQG